MSINVEVIGGRLVSHYVEEISEKHHLGLASVSDSFTPTGRTTLQVTWDLSKAIAANKCEFTNYVHSRPTEEFLEFLAKQGIPFEQFRQARQPVSEAHNRQENAPFRSKYRACRPKEVKNKYKVCPSKANFKQDLKIYIRR